MVGVQDERHVQRFFRRIGWLFTVEQQQEIARVTKRCIRLNNALPFADAIPVRHNHGDLRGQAEGFAQVGIVLIAGFIRIVEGQRRNHRPQHLHWSCCFRNLLHPPPLVVASQSNEVAAAGEFLHEIHYSRALGG